MNQKNYRLAWLKAHKIYERRIYKIFRKYFVDAANGINFMFLTETNYEAQINSDIKIFDIYRAYYDAYLSVGITHGKKVGKGINKEIKEFNPIAFETEYQRNLYNWILENVGQSIVSIHDTFKQHIVQIIANGIKEGLTIEQISSKMVKLINNRSFYRWQALRIARTETTAAANHAAMVSGNVSGIVLEKVWISGTDDRTRRIPRDAFDHLHMNGKKVDKDKPFEVPNKLGFIELLPYPGSKKTQSGAITNAADVINCRCTAALVPKRDSNGRIVRV